MKIVHSVYSMEMGGAETLVAQLCRLQRKKGHEVTVCAYASLGVLGQALREEGYRIILDNSNPAKIMTDQEMADACYDEPITPAVVAKIIE